MRHPREGSEYTGICLSDEINAPYEGGVCAGRRGWKLGRGLQVGFLYLKTFPSELLCGLHFLIIDINLRKARSSDRRAELSSGVLES